MIPSTLLAFTRRAFKVSILALALGSVAASCASSDGPNRLERIDGPAQVDPDFGGLDDGTVVKVDDSSNDPESGG